MRYRVFLDTNILISGIFFEGNESKVLDKEAQKLMRYKKDVPILASVLYANPDYFLTGDAHFHTEGIKKIVNVVTAKDFLNLIK